MTTTTVRCYGGPMDGQEVAIDGHGPVMFPLDLVSRGWGDPPGTVRYDRQRWACYWYARKDEPLGIDTGHYDLFIRDLAAIPWETEILAYDDAATEAFDREAYIMHRLMAFLTRRCR